MSRLDGIEYIASTSISPIVSIPSIRRVHPLSVF